MAEEATIDVRMTESTDDGSDEVQRGRIRVRVSDESDNPLPAATITVSGLETDYEKSKGAEDHGMFQTFENVPIPARVLVEATGYEDESTDVTESNLGSSWRVGYDD